MAGTLRSMRRGVFALTLAGCTSFVLSFVIGRQQTVRATAGLNRAAQQLDSLTDGLPADDRRRAAIVWGYAERLRLGLESPFRLIEASGGDPRLAPDERRMVSWALLAHVLRGESHEIDAAALDGLGGGSLDNGQAVRGEEHLRLIRGAVNRASDSRAAELAVRMAYTLATAERLVDPSAPVLVAEAAALLADREIARREAISVVRSANGADPLNVVRQRRARRAFYVERPTLLAPGEQIENEASVLAPELLDSLRRMHASRESTAAPRNDNNVRALMPRLFAAGVHAAPVAPLAVTVQQYLPLVRTQAPGLDHGALMRTRNAEMLLAVTHLTDTARAHRRVIGRLLLAAAVSMRSLAQEPVRFAGDSAMRLSDAASTAGLRGISFDADVPRVWRLYYVHALVNAVLDLRRVLPDIRLDELWVRFRMKAPADSALAMHDPRTRTLHLPILSAAGTLSHELAHDLDRQSAQDQGLPGYRSDVATRAEREAGSGREARATDGRLAASLRALTEERSSRPSRATNERPAEIFATRVDWLVAEALARQGISNGFLSAVQDEILTGHVVHPERLRTSGRSRSLLDALEEMTPVAPFATRDEAPTVQTLLGWSLTGPFDRGEASAILRGESHDHLPTRLLDSACAADGSPRTRIVRMAAESRARGWMRLRARWTPSGDRPAWAHSVLREAPWSPAVSEQRVAELRDYILTQLSSSEELPAGLGAYAAPRAARARCGNR